LVTAVTAQQDQATWVNAQPTLRPTKYGTLALAHNGNLTNTGDLAGISSKT
jgi:amidophosphoribosyltransferase